MCADPHLQRKDYQAYQEKSYADTKTCCDEAKLECKAEIYDWGKFQWCLNTKETGGSHQSSNKITKAIEDCCKKQGGQVMTNVVGDEFLQDKCEDSSSPENNNSTGKPTQKPQ